MTQRWRMVLGGWALSAGIVLAANPSRFVARFANDSIVESNLLKDWHSPESAPKLENLPLFDPANPFRWLVDRSQAPDTRLSEAFLEMTTGDRLPGVVVGYRGGDESVYSPLPPHLVVEYQGPGVSNLEATTRELRVDLRYVRRVVWSRSTRLSHQPRTAFLRDGGFLQFRSLRWSAGAVSLLLESGPRRVPLSELAGIDLAPTNYWTAYFDELAVSAPDSQRRLLQCETPDGFIITTAIDRLQPRVVGDAKDVNRWLLGTQPAWSLDILWLWQGTIRTRRSFAPHEVPLSRVPPVRIEQRSPLDTSSLGPARFPLAINRNLQGGPLRAAMREAGWGFGVQAFSELEFEFPAAARHFQSRFGIDPQMQDGGCVQARVLHASAGGKVLYQSPVLVGSQSEVDTGRLALSTSGTAPQRIVLQVDPVLTNRPANADPLDIRDQANWIDPLLELDPAILKQQTEERLPRQQLAWRGWSVTLDPGAQSQHGPFWAEAPFNLGEYRTAVSVTGSAMKLTKSHSLSPEDQWLVVDAVRTQSAGPAAKLAVKIDEAMPVEWDVPAYDKSRSDFRPLILSLAGLHAKKKPQVPIEIRQLPTNERVPIVWRAIAIVGQHPMFYRLLEDALPPSASLAAGATQPLAGEFDEQQKYTGLQSLRLPAGREWKWSPENGKPLAIRERPQLGEYRFLRFVVKKQGGGGMRMAVQQLTEADNFPATYVAGANQSPDPLVKSLSNQPLSKDWQVFTRDLYGDFGNLDITGLSCIFPDGEIGWLDHVYLARTQNDYQLIKSP